MISQGEFYSPPNVGDAVRGHAKHGGEQLPLRDLGAAGLAGGRIEF